MEGFDRDALVARTEKSGTGKWFWAGVAALPVAGIAGGLVLGFGGSPSQPTLEGIDIQQGDLRVAAVVPQAALPGEPARSAFSARDEVEKYQATLGTLSQCAGGYGNYDQHMVKAMDAYRKANEAKLVKLRDMANAEYKRDTRSRMERLPDGELEMWAGAVTGQLQREIANEMTTLAAEFDRHDRMRGGYLGPDPSNGDCIQFRNDVIMGKQNVKLG